MEEFGMKIAILVLAISSLLAVDVNDTCLITTKEYYPDSYDKIVNYNTIFDSSGNTYYQGRVKIATTPGFLGTLTKMNKSDELVYFKVYSCRFIQTPLPIDSTGSFMYFICDEYVGDNYLRFGQISTLDGAVQWTMKNTDVQCYKEFCQIILDEEADKLYMTVYNSASTTNICSYSLGDVQPPFGCIEPQCQVNYINSIIQIEDDKLFFYCENEPNNDLYFHYLTYSTQVVEWAYSVACPALSSCDVPPTYYTQSTYDYDAERIHSVVPYEVDSVFQSIYIVMEKETGSLHTFYKLGDAGEECDFCFYLDYHNEEVITALRCSSNTMLSVYDTIEDSFTKYDIVSGIFLYAVNYNNRLGTWLFSGDSQSATHFYTSNVSGMSCVTEHPDYAGDSVVTFAPVTTEYSYVVVVHSVTDWQDYLATNETSSADAIADSEEDLFLNTGTEYHSYVRYDESTNIITAIQDRSSMVFTGLGISRALDDKTVLNYAITQTGAFPLPAWVSINTGAPILLIDSPVVTEDTEYRFNIETTIQGNPKIYTNLVILTVRICKADNCDRCEDFDVNKCEICSNGYYLYEYECQKELSFMTPEESQYFTLGVIGASILAVLITSLIDDSSPIAVWSIVNQMQLLLLLLITGAYVPAQIVVYLTGFTFLTFSYEDIPLLKMINVQNMAEGLHATQNEEDLDSVGVFSKSSFVTNLGIFINFGVAILTHLLLFLVYKGCKSEKNKNKCCIKLLARTLKWITFGFYIRLVIEGYQLLVTSSMAEIYEASFGRASDSNSRLLSEGSDNDKISLYLAISILVCCVIFLFIYLIHLIKFKLPTKYMTELYAGLKPKRTLMTYGLYCRLRRFILILIIISFRHRSLQNVGLWVKALCQMFFLILLMCMKPLIKTQDNMIEVVNESVFTILALMICLAETFSLWSYPYSSSMFNLLLANTLIVFMIIMVPICVSLVKCLIRCKKRRQDQVVSLSSQHVVNQRQTNVQNMATLSQNNSSIRMSNDASSFVEMNRPGPTQNREYKPSLRELCMRDSPFQNPTKNP